MSTVHHIGTQVDDIKHLQITIDRLRRQLATARKEYVCPNCRNIRILSKEQPFEKMKPSDAVLAMLREFDRPVGVGHLRRHLEARGYPINQFRSKNYFYTLIWRLAQSGKIARLEGDEVMITG